jgi:class 3 adenylate cyclase
LQQSLEQQTATADVLRVISSSPGELQPVFEAMLENATRLCEANFGNMFLHEGTGFRTVAIHSPPSAYTEWYERHPFVEPTKEYPHSTLARLIETKKILHIADLRLDRGYLEGYPPIVALVDDAGARTDLLVPMLKEDQLIGAIVIYRTEVRPFTEKQIELVQNFAAQAVIAIENSRLLNELRESLDRQTATADILRVIASTPEDSKPALDTIAETAPRMFGVANVNFRRIEGDVLRIVSSAGPTIERLRKALPDIPLEPTDPAVRCFLENHQVPVEDRQAVLANERGAIAAALRELPVRSQVFTPLSRRGKAIGVMIVTRGEVRLFQEHEIELMRGFADQAVIAIENARLLSELRDSYRMVQKQAGKLEAQSQELVKLNQQLEQRVADQVGEIERMGRLRRFLPPQVADLIVASGTERQLESHRREITALFCDLRGFTGFSESSDPEDVIALLREYHAAIGQIIVKYSGTLERFAGDGVMVIFNDPVPVENPALQAVLMALDMRTAIGAMIEKWRDLGHDLGFGIGIAHGFATLGTIGFEGRFDYAAIGTVSNVASRLCDEAKPGQILISPRVRQAVDRAVTVEPVGEFTLKGIRRPMMTYNVLESLPSKPN